MYGQRKSGIRGDGHMAQKEWRQFTLGRQTGDIRGDGQMIVGGQTCDIREMDS